jgi:hypothetical protein
MFGARYFGKRYFAGRFWPKVTDGSGPVIVDLSADMVGLSSLSADLEVASGAETTGGPSDRRKRQRRRDEEDLLIMLMAA